MPPQQPKRPKPIEMGEIRCSATNRTRPDGRWYWRARRRAARDTLWTGWATRDEALAELAELLRRGLPSPTEAAPKAATVGDLLEAWLAHQESRHEVGELAARTVAGARGCLELVVGKLGPVPLPALGQAHLDDAALDLRARGYAPSTAGLALTHVLSAIAWGTKRGILQPRALEKPRQKAARVYNDYTPTLDEVRAVVDALHSEDHRRCLRFLSWTGCRIGEAANFTGADVDVGRRLLTLTGKTGPRTVPLVGEAAEVLLEWARGALPGARWFPDHVPAALANALSRACPRAGVPTFSPHGVRRLVVTTLLEAGVDPATVATITGHSPVVMLRAYARPSDDARRRAMAALDTTSGHSAAKPSAKADA